MYRLLRASFRLSNCWIPGILGMLVWAASPVAGQTTNRFSLPTQFQGLSAPGQPGSEVQVAGQIELTADGKQGVLRVTARLGPGWHIYSLTQPDGGPLRTRIVLEPSSGIELTGAFQPDNPPLVRRLDVFDVPVEEHHEKVTWTAPLRVVGDTPVGELVIRGKLDGQVCQEDGGCVPLSTLDTRFEAQVSAKPLPAMPAVASVEEPEKRRIPPVDAEQVAAAELTPVIPANLRFAPAPPEGYRAGSVHVAMQGQVEPAGAAPGETVHVVLTAVPDRGWHVYAYAQKDPLAISKPLLIAVAEPSGWSVGEVRASEDPIVKQTGLPLEPEQRYHEQKVSWRVPVTIPASTQPGPYTIRGMIGYQTCSASQCDMPVGAYFATTINVGKQAQGAVPLQFGAGNYAAVAKFLDPPPAAPPTDRSAAAAPPAASVGTIEFDLSRIQVEGTDDQSTAYILVVALLGGFLLNFMPCVLPVIGLKIMSFVQQAGEHRARVFALNVWYALGMLSIFWLLATLALASSFGWGEQYNYDEFTIPLLCVVFVMGLSFIGVWEIPIPGFVGSGRANELAQREGLGGAFFKGIITTILATPCSGPGLATALTWSANKPPSQVYLAFTAMGLGMALPYLLIGAFPRLVRFIPKPGAWMETFKQLMGFVLMGTVVYLFTLIDTAHVVPTLALIFALWAGCWWIGRTPITVSGFTKLASWLAAGAFSALVGWFAFGYEHDTRHELPWQEFSLAALDTHVKAERTVLVDFTARWCPTCKVLERSVLNTKPVHDLVEKNDVVTLVADWSDMGEEIGTALQALGSKQLPVIAIFPAGDAYRPTKLTGLYTRGELLRALQAAGPSNVPRLAADAS
jgi:thiol:disulfide interchange protein